MRRFSVTLITIVFAVPVIAGVASASDALRARQLEREALTAYAAKDPSTFLEKMTTAVGLRPDHPRLLFHLAAAQAVNEQPEDAVNTLNLIANLGVAWRIPREEEFDPLWDRADFQRALARLAENEHRVIGAGDIAFTLPEMRGLIEGIAWRESTSEYFFGDVRERCVWRRSADGSMTRFTADDDRVFGVFGLTIDESRGALWVATSVVPEMHGYGVERQNAAGLAEFDLASGALRRVVLLPADGQNHVLGDLALAPDGGVFVTDSVASVLWRLPAGGEVLELFAESEEFMSLQGIVFTADGRGLWLTAYGNGLLHVDLATREVRRLGIPPATTLLGCDGIACTAGDDLILVQNGGTPTRILRVTTSADRTAVAQIRVVVAAHATMADATLGCIGGSDFVFIADGGWRLFSKDAATPTGPRTVPIMRVRLE